MENTCVICFEELYGKIKASPNTCDHIFCLPCLEKWSKLGSFCPVDRRRFKKIINLESERCIQVKPRKRKKEKPLYDISTKCEICLNDNNPDVLLLCDCCDLAFHMFCLKPPLENIPAGLWYCPTCISVDLKIKKKNGITKELEADSGNALLQVKKEDNVKSIVTGQTKQNYGEESLNKGTEQNFIKFCGIQSVNNEQCSSECKESVNVLSDSQDISCSNNLTCTNKTEEEIDKKKINKKKDKFLFHQKERLENADKKCSNIDKMCLNKTALQDDGVLNDNLFQEVAFGFMKADLEYETDVSKTRFHILCTDVKSEQSDELCKSSHDFSFRTKAHKISSTNTEDSSLHSTKSFSRLKILKNTNCGDVSDVNSLSSSSSVSSDFSKERNVSQKRNNLRPNYENKEEAVKTCRDFDPQISCLCCNFSQSKPRKVETTKSRKVKSNKYIKNISMLDTIKKSEEKTSFNSFKQDGISTLEENDSKFLLNNFDFTGKCKKDKTSKYEDIKVKNSTFCPKDLEHLTIRSDGTFYLNVPKMLQKSSHSACNFNVNKTIKHENPLHLTIQNNESKNYLACDKEKSVIGNFQKSCSSISSILSKPIYHSDLKYLTVGKDGTFILDLPMSDDVKVAEKAGPESNIVCKSRNNLCHTDLKHLRIQSDGTFFLDMPD